MSMSEAQSFLDMLGSNWEITNEAKTLTGRFSCENYASTLAFVNDVARIAIEEDHHPEISFGYDTVVVSFSTHTVNGLSSNDFIAASKVTKQWR